MSWLLAFLGFAALIILHEAGHFAAAKAVGMRVERFALFFPPLLARVRRGETEYAVGAIPLGGYVRITGMNPQEEIPPEHAHRAYYRQPVWKRIVVIAAGPAVNIVLAFVILWALYLANGVSAPTTTVESVAEKQPAAGKLAPGDRIVAIDGVRSTDFAVLRDQISAHTCPGEQRDGCSAATPARVTIVRGDGPERTLTITPVYSAEVQRMLLGFSPASTDRAVGPIDAAGISVDSMWAFTRGTVETIAGIFDSEKRQQISGVVGSYETTRQAFQFSTEQALFLLAVISLSLGVINLFPFLPLDGGHIFWAVAEKVRGRAIPFGVMERAGFIGFALVIALFMVGLTNDIGRLTGDGFPVR
jgi:regulator of sigma E protease